MKVHYPPQELPVIKTCDLVVSGGSFAAISSALDYAAQGKKVVLIEARTYLGREMTACQRPWMSRNEIEALAPLPKALLVVLTECCSKTIRDEIIFSLDQVKITLEEQLINMGVQILYASRVIGVLQPSGVIRGVIIGNKSGRQVIGCKTYLDFSGIRSRLQHPALLPDQGASGSQTFWRTLEFNGVDLEWIEKIPLPEFLDQSFGYFRVHPGFVSDRHWFVEYPVSTHMVDKSPSDSEHEFAMQKLTADTVKYLVENVDAFRGAQWVGGSYESYPWSENLAGYSTRAEPVNPTQRQIGSTDDNDEEFLPARDHNPFQNATLPSMEVPALSVDWWNRVDVLVVGGGTSGVAAALMAAEKGLTTLLVEMNSRVGGTGTIGGVQSYWFGRDAGYSARMMKVIEKIHREFLQPITNGEIPRWNIEVKAWALCNKLHESQVKVLFNTLAIGTANESRKIHSVVCASPEGLGCIQARIVIDATGDGDLAAFSGAKFTFGSERNRSTMWYSLAQFTEPGQTSNNFTSMVNVGNIEDYTRAILSGRRRGRNTIEHGTYLATRESRQILGETRLTLTDQLRQKKFKDVIHVAFSNYDVKGHTDSDWLRAGLIPPNLEVEIPLGAILPQGIDNLLVVGKAISGSHDALPSVRMQRDLENLGAAAGIIAAMACQSNRELREIPIREVQHQLIQADLLPEDVLTRDCQEAPVDVKNQLTLLKAEHPLYFYSDMDMHDVYRGTIPFVEICCAGPNAISLIRDEFERSNGSRRLLLAQALAMIGDPGGFYDLFNAVNLQLSGDQLPERNTAIRNTQLPPDQGAMPDVVYLLYSLGMLRMEAAIPTFEKVAALLGQSEKEDFYSQVKGTFYYIDAICYFAERLGSVRCENILNSLRKIPCLQNKVCVFEVQVDFVEERLAFLELSIARAMLRCGIPKGLIIAIGYLKDKRANLRDHAYELLVMFTGVDLKQDSPAWEEWFTTRKVELLPRPDTSPTDAQKTWEKVS